MVPGYANHPELRARVAIDFRRDLARDFTQMRNRYVRDVRVTWPGKAAPFPQHRFRPARDRILYEIAPIACLAGIRDERVTRSHISAVGHEPRNAQSADAIPIERRSACSRRCAFHTPGSAFAHSIVEPARSGHTSSLISGALGGGRTTLLTGASGGTASRRSAPDMTAAKTGAAMEPP